MRWDARALPLSPVGRTSRAEWELSEGTLEDLLAGHPLDNR